MEKILKFCCFAFAFPSVCLFPFFLFQVRNKPASVNATSVALFNCLYTLSMALAERKLKTKCKQQQTE